MEEILSVQDLKRVYGRGTAATQALGGVSLSVEQGEFVGIMGPSGSGKTTLLNCIATIDRPTSGSIRVGGQELTGLRGRATPASAGSGWALSFRTATCWTPSPPLRISPWPWPSQRPRRGRSKAGCGRWPSA